MTETGETARPSARAVSVTGPPRKAVVYRWLRRFHVCIAVVTAAPLVVTSLTGALLVFGHELSAVIRPPVTVAAESAGPALAYSTLLDRIAEQRPDIRPWALVPQPDPLSPWRVWLSGGGGVIEIDPYDGTIVDAYKGTELPYDIVRALHRRWLVDQRPASDWTRTIISVSALALMIQLTVGVVLWALPPRRLRRLRPAYGGNRRLLVQRLHTVTGVITALLLFAIAFTGLSMYWTQTARSIVDTLLPGVVEQPKPPAVAKLRAVADLDAAVAMAQRLVPDARVASVRPPDRPGAPVHVSLSSKDSGVNSRVWIGDAPLRVLKFYDGRNASMATRFWHFKYWLHIGDFAGWPVRVLWLLVSLTPTGFVATGLWLWRDRTRVRRRGR